MTVAAVVAGLGFGLVIAPISTSALNAVRDTQLGSASALVTVMRMVGMIVGLAALTAWALARFKALVAPYPPPLPLAGESAASYAARVGAYNTRIVLPAAHQVYTDVFAAAALLCLLALVPAWLLWRRRAGSVEAARPPYESYVAPLA
jgi:hypothetical protein